jgi:DNA-binding transcriptional LysR family regulator
MLDVKRLRIFCEVARRRSFSDAADLLSYTQSAVSQNIAALEREFGVGLFDRTTRRVELTDAGHALLGHAEDILARVAEAESELLAYAGVETGRLRLVCFPTAGATLMPVAIATYRISHPGVELSLLEAEPDTALRMLREGEADLAVIIESSDRTSGVGEGVKRLHLFDDPMFIALPRSHPLARKRSIELGRLADEDWISVTTPRDSALLRRACQEAGFEPRIVFRSDDYHTIQGFVAARIGVALIPGLALQKVREDVRIYPLGPDGPKRAAVAAWPSASKSPPAASMIDTLVTASAELVAAPSPSRARRGRPGQQEPLMVSRQ